VFINVIFVEMLSSSIQFTNLSAIIYIEFKLFSSDKCLQAHIYIRIAYTFVCLRVCVCASGCVYMYIWSKVKSQSLLVV